VTALGRALPHVADDARWALLGALEYAPDEVTTLAIRLQGYPDSAAALMGLQDVPRSAWSSWCDALLGGRQPGVPR
jgi:hypothetical protein